MMQQFKGKVVFITGGTNGMGFATAQAFTEAGARVIITGRSEQTVNKAVAALGPSATGIVSDAGKMTDILALPAQLRQYTDRIDVLFANAGYGKFASIEQVNEAHFDELFNILVKGTFFTVQQLLPLLASGSSIILNTSFVTAFGIPYFSVYTAAKAAVQSFIKTFSMECTAKGIRVNGISPGYIRTNIFNNTGLTAEEIAGTIDSVIPTLPYKRFGEPWEIAKTVLFLASPDAGYIHGAEILVDGGLSNVK
ncbi:NAD(P)-dependent dehydrogenase, short-chain alcohol dehydrogenase family [Chitinophaga eiseniae]|uniref:NAD(P)-dependent dehydrogenase, short-chain alcohol dehydrogenase family n=1 Tax=Chitinophaga eiseniae TaxID=634771 RepID=A0A1T4MD54_9BACT|nr:SDR family oxidoreductase [Chitinophaga eiseniae]SJZ64805.1 NAD(P)-dependent dehydrogenase, short-chain alcohol dehydrogenase family [Chitinophaga eiseniae]